jgi:hypothetical protein
MATAIFFGGRRINLPGAYSELDTSLLAGLSPGAVGIVALVGEAEGGKPLTVEPEHSDHTRSATVLQRYMSGPLLTAGSFAFEPSNDDAIPGGAQRLVNVKVNPATQSAVTLPDALAADSLVLTSKDWGLFTEQENAQIAAGTNQGKKYTLVFEDTIEEFDDVGGDDIFSVLYTNPGNGWDAVTGQVTSTQFLAAAAKLETGLDADRTNDIASAGVVDLASDNAGDTTQTVTVYGLLANVPVSEAVALNGTTNVQTTQTFDKMTAVASDGALAGTVTVSNFPVTTTLFALSGGPGDLGMVATADMPVSGVITVAIDVDTAVDVVIRGLTATGVPIAERFDMTAGNTTPVVGSTTFASVTSIELGDVAGARTVTFSANAVATTHTAQTTVQKVIDRINALDGFLGASIVGNPTTFLMTSMDFEAAVSILATTGFEANLNASIIAINNGSAIVTASRATGAAGVAANTTVPVYLAGGGEGTTTISEWQAAFNLLKKRRVNIIVPLTNDPAVHNLLVGHLKLRAGALRSEANGYAGIGTNDGAGETRGNIKTQIKTLGTRHVSAISEEAERFDPLTGVQTFYPPYVAAAVAAGMQAGSPIGEPLTNKRPLFTNVRKDTSWTTEDDSEEMVDAGLMFTREDDDVGIVWVRSITTHLADDNVVLTEMSANESANTATFELRRQMDLAVGGRGLGGSLAAMKGRAFDVLERLVEDDIIVAFRSLQMEQIGDVFPLSVEIAPVLPINFIPITVHVVATRAAA